MIGTLIDLLLLALGIYRALIPVGNAFGGPKYVARVNTARNNIAKNGVIRGKVRFSLAWQIAFDILLFAGGFAWGDLLLSFAGLVLLVAEGWTAWLYFHSNPLVAVHEAPTPGASEIEPPQTH